MILHDVLHGYIDRWLGKEVGRPSTEEPIMITLDHALLLWSILSDPPALVRAFGRVLCSPLCMRRLAARVLCALSAKCVLPIDPSIGIPMLAIVFPFRYLV